MNLFLFPAIKTDNTVEEQFGKILEEVEELREEVELGEYDSDAIAFEAYNVMQASETLVRMLPSNSAQIGYLKTKAKNAERGYYED